jgi:uncharacterized integral membrane protein (TIGR00697 family)
MENKGFKYFPWFLTAFISLLLVSNVIAGRLVEVWGIVATSAMFLFPLSYVVQDIVPEVYGFSTARKMVWFGALANVIMVLMFMFANALPYPAFFADTAASYSIVLGIVPRIVIFSILAYLAGSFVNATIMAKMKEWMVKWDPNHKWLALRTIGSTLAGEGVDSLIFIFGSFLFALPFSVVLTMFFVQWLIKVLVEVAMTPVTYIVVDKIKKLEGVDMVATPDTSYNPFSLKQEAETNLKA